MSSANDRGVHSRKGPSSSRKSRYIWSSKAEANLLLQIDQRSLLLKDTDSLKTALLSIENFVSGVPIVNENGVFLGMLTEGMLFSVTSSVRPHYKT